MSAGPSVLFHQRPIYTSVIEPLGRALLEYNTLARKDVWAPLVFLPRGEHATIHELQLRIPRGKRLQTGGSGLPKKLCGLLTRCPDIVAIVLSPMPPRPVFGAFAPLDDSVAEEEAQRHWSILCEAHAHMQAHPLHRNYNVEDINAAIAGHAKAVYTPERPLIGPPRALIGRVASVFDQLTQTQGWKSRMEAMRS